MSFRDITRTFTPKSTPSKRQRVPNVSPFFTSHPQDFMDRDQFYQRVATFSVATWYGKPNEINPLICSQHGYINTGSNIIACCDCGKTLSFTSTNLEVQKQLVPDFLKKLKEHKDDCVFKDNSSPIEFVNPFLTFGGKMEEDKNKLIQIAEFKQRLASYANLNDPVIHKDFLEELDVATELDQVSTVYTNKKHIESPKIIIAVYNWSYESLNQRDYYNCTICQARRPVNFSDDFHPMKEHRWWCPVISRFVPTCGYKYILDSLVHPPTFKDVHEQVGLVKSMIPKTPKKMPDSLEFIKEKERQIELEKKIQNSQKRIEIRNLAKKREMEESRTFTNLSNIPPVTPSETFAFGTTPTPERSSEIARELFAKTPSTFEPTVVAEETSQDFQFGTKGEIKTDFSFSGGENQGFNLTKESNIQSFSTENPFSGSGFSFSQEKSASAFGSTTESTSAFGTTGGFSFEETVVQEKTQEEFVPQDKPFFQLESNPFPFEPIGETNKGFEFGKDTKPIAFAFEKDQDEDDEDVFSDEEDFVPDESVPSFAFGNDNKVNFEFDKQEDEDEDDVVFSSEEEEEQEEQEKPSQQTFGFEGSGFGSSEQINPFEQDKPLGFDFGSSDQQVKTVETLGFDFGTGNQVEQVKTESKQVLENKPFDFDTFTTKPPQQEKVQEVVSAPQEFKFKGDAKIEFGFGQSSDEDSDVFSDEEEEKAPDASLPAFSFGNDNKVAFEFGKEEKSDDEDDTVWSDEEAYPRDNSSQQKPVVIDSDTEGEEEHEEEGEQQGEFDDFNQDEGEKEEEDDEEEEETGKDAQEEEQPKNEFKFDVPVVQSTNESLQFNLPPYQAKDLKFDQQIDFKPNEKQDEKSDEEDQTGFAFSSTTGNTFGSSSFGNTSFSNENPFEETKTTFTSEPFAFGGSSFATTSFGSFENPVEKNVFEEEVEPRQQLSEKVEQEAKREEFSPDLSGPQENPIQKLERAPSPDLTQEEAISQETRIDSQASQDLNVKPQEEMQPVEPPKEEEKTQNVQRVIEFEPMGDIGQGVEDEMESQDLNVESKTMSQQEQVPKKESQPESQPSQEESLEPVVRKTPSRRSKRQKSVEPIVEEPKQPKESTEEEPKRITRGSLLPPKETRPKRSTPKPMYREPSLREIYTSSVTNITPSIVKTSSTGPPSSGWNTLETPLKPKTLLFDDSPQDLAKKTSRPLIVTPTIKVSRTLRSRERKDELLDSDPEINTPSRSSKRSKRKSEETHEEESHPKKSRDEYKSGDESEHTDNERPSLPRSAKKSADKEEKPSDSAKKRSLRSNK